MLSNGLVQLENIVRLLLDLEPELDHIWHYLNIQNQRIRGLLEKCTLDHETMMEQLQNEIREKVLSDAKWKQVQQDLNDVSGTDRIVFKLFGQDPSGIPSDLQSQTCFWPFNLVRKKLQLVGITALLLSCKYEEVAVPVVEDLIVISDRAYNRIEILEMNGISVLSFVARTKSCSRNP
ncbi:hypothetical protein AgCh_030421 [Apium graveolens]